MYRNQGGGEDYAGSVKPFDRVAADSDLRCAANDANPRIPKRGYIGGVKAPE